jgi:hypothetical protein
MFQGEIDPSFRVTEKSHYDMPPPSRVHESARLTTKNADQPYYVLSKVVLFYPLQVSTAKLLLAG